MNNSPGVIRRSASEIALCCLRGLRLGLGLLLMTIIVCSVFPHEYDLGLQSAQMRIQELESLIKRNGSRTSFESVLRREPLSDLSAAHSQAIIDSAIDRRFPANERDREHWFEKPLSDFEHSALDALHAQDSLPRAHSLPDDGDSGDLSLSSFSSDDDDMRKRNKNKIKKRPMAPYKVQNTKMRLPQYPNALMFESWRRAIRTTTISASEKL